MFFAACGFTFEVCFVVYVLCFALSCRWFVGLAGFVGRVFAFDV